MSDRCAPRHTSKAFAAGDLTLTVAGGAPIHVYGIWLNNSNGGAQNFQIQDGSGNLIQTVELVDQSAVELSVYWIADAGIKIVASDVDLHATVFHNSPGR